MSAHAFCVCVSLSVLGEGLAPVILGFLIAVFLYTPHPLSLENSGAFR